MDYQDLMRLLRFARNDNMGILQSSQSTEITILNCKVFSAFSVCSVVKNRLFTKASNIESHFNIYNPQAKQKHVIS